LLAAHLARFIAEVLFIPQRPSQTRCFSLPIYNLHFFITNLHPITAGWQAIFHRRSEFFFHCCSLPNHPQSSYFITSKHSFLFIAQHSTQTNCF